MKEIKGVNVTESATKYITLDLESGDGVKLDEVEIVAVRVT